MNKENWGDLSSIDGIGQITRAMLDMRKPKPFCSQEYHQIKISEPAGMLRKQRLSSYSKNIIELMDYINEVESLGLEDEMVNSIKFPVYPNLDSTSENDSSVSNSLTSNNLQASSISFNDIEKHLMHGIALLAATYGFESSSSTALLTLTDILLKYTNTICVNVRATLDNEAFTGKTGFFDCTDQVLHDLGIGGIHDLKNYYERNVVQYHKTLLEKSKKARSIVQAYQEKKEKMQLVKVKQEKSLYVNWIPASNISSNYVSSDNNITSSRWKPFIKNEPTAKSSDVQSSFSNFSSRGSNS